MSRVTPPKGWQNPESNWKAVLSHAWYRNLLEIQHVLQSAAHNYFSSEKILTMSMPVTTGSISSPMGIGSDSIPVEISLFGCKTFLADSMQFMLEFGCRLCPAGVYYVMPCFRGEQTDQYHLPQFCHVESEIQGTLDNIIDVASRMVHAITKRMVDDCFALVTAAAGQSSHLEGLLKRNGNYPRIRLADAITELGPKPNLVSQLPNGCVTLTRAGEAEIVRRLGQGPAVWITHFPHLAVPFYQAIEAGTDVALNADLILGNCETIGAGQRHLSAADVRKALSAHQVNPTDYAWYTEMRELHPMQTSGFGMGMERYLLWLLNHDDVRDMTLLYRENGKSFAP